nr:uncharacterized protein LOC109158392 [Ipomoea batatas]
MKDKYEDCTTLLVTTLKEYLALRSSALFWKVDELTEEVVDMNWKESKNYIDCGLFVMRHMETYNGTLKKWNPGFRKKASLNEDLLIGLRARGRQGGVLLPLPKPRRCRDARRRKTIAGVASPCYCFAESTAVDVRESQAVASPENRAIRLTVVAPSSSHARCDERHALPRSTPPPPSVALPLKEEGGVRRHYFLVCINIKASKVEIIDNKALLPGVTKKDKYGDCTNLLVTSLKEYLALGSSDLFWKVDELTEEVVNMHWKETENYIDCELFVMRHMETYNGTLKKWNPGFKRKTSLNEDFLLGLRAKYAAAIIRWRANTLKYNVIKKTKVLYNKK